VLVESARTHVRGHTYAPPPPPPLPPTLCLLSLPRPPLPLPLPPPPPPRVSGRKRRISGIESAPRRQVKWISIESAAPRKVPARGGGAAGGWRAVEKNSKCLFFCKCPAGTRAPVDRQAKRGPERERKASGGMKIFPRLVCRKTRLLFRYECMTYRFGIIKFGKADSPSQFPSQSLTSERRRDEARRGEARRGEARRGGLFST
jgi:hypothetical protein